MTDQRTLTVRIWRGGETGALHTYSVPARDNQTVLDVVTEVQRALEPSLAYRFACRVGVCGSCAMTVNGTPRWTCRTHINRVIGDGVITIEPLRNLPRIKDLVCDMAPFFEKWTAAGGTFAGSRSRAEPPAPIDPMSPKRREADAAIECINCAVCYASCDVVAANPGYLGPAALSRAWTLVNDERIANRDEVKQKALGADGCGSCHSHGSCMQNCPIGLSPTRSIAGLKRLSLLHLFGAVP
ncbi:MAG: succinate dehydrogenase/fumarate reductase iron-sulfur subunit [Geminicoccaceae bacterium]